MIIDEIMTRAKWNEDLERRALAEKALDFYNDNHNPTLTSGYGYISKMIYDRIDKEEAEIIDNYVEPDNMTARIVDERSIMFRVPAEITLENGSEAQTKNWEILKEQTNINSILQELQKYANLNHDVGCVPEIYSDLQGKNPAMSLDIITPDISFVQQREDDTTKAKKFFYQTGILENTASSDDNYRYIYWDIDGKHECEITTNGSIDKDTVNDIDSPFKGVIPVIMFRNYVPTNTFWFNGKNYLVEKNAQIDYRLTCLNVAEDWNIPQKVRTGTDPEKEGKVGFTFTEDIIRNDAGEAVGDVKYISPNFPIKDEIDAIDWRKFDTAASYGLAVDSMKGTTFTSGYMAYISKQEIIAINEREQGLYLKPIKDLCTMMTIAAKDLGMKFPDNPEWKIDFGELTYAESPQEKETNRALRLANGTATLVDFEMEDNPDLTREEALGIVLERQKEKELLRPTNPYEGGEDENSNNPEN